MESSSAHKIKPYLPKRFSIDSKSTYSIFMKHKPKILSHFIFNNSASSSSGRHKHPQKLLNILKHLIYVQRLDLGRFYLQKINSNLPYMMSSAKKMSRVHFLSTVNSQSVEGPCLKIFQMWPKYIYHLKALVDSTDRNQLWLVLNESSFHHLMKESPKSVLFRYQHSIETFRSILIQINLLLIGLDLIDILSLSKNSHFLVASFKILFL